MKANPTPGPWRSVEMGSEGSRIFPDVENMRERMKFIAIVCGRDTLTDFANGKIIATAPNGVELARRVKVLVQAMSLSDVATDELDACEEIANSILAIVDGVGR